MANRPLQDPERTAAGLVRHVLTGDQESVNLLLSQSIGPDKDVPEPSMMMILGALSYASRAVKDLAAELGVPPTQIVDGHIRYMAEGG